MRNVYLYMIKSLTISTAVKKDTRGMNESDSSTQPKKMNIDWIW